MLLRLARCAPEAWSLAIASRSTATLDRRTSGLARGPIGQLDSGTATWLAWTLVSAVVRTISHRRAARRVATTGWTRTALRRIATTSRAWRARTALSVLASALRTRRAILTAGKRLAVALHERTAVAVVAAFVTLPFFVAMPLERRRSDSLRPMMVVLFL